jgi:hypothetical protein
METVIAPPAQNFLVNKNIEDKKAKSKLERAMILSSQSSLPCRIWLIKQDLASVPPPGSPPIYTLDIISV